MSDGKTNGAGGGDEHGLGTLADIFGKIADTCRRLDGSLESLGGYRRSELLTDLKRELTKTRYAVMQAEHHVGNLALESLSDEIERR